METTRFHDCGCGCGHGRWLLATTMGMDLSGYLKPYRAWIAPGYLQVVERERERGEEEEKKRKKRSEYDSLYLVYAKEDDIITAHLS